MSIRKLLLSFGLSCTAICLSVEAADTAPAATTSLDMAMNRLYNTDYPGALNLLNQWTAQHPADPLGFAFKGSDYLFSEFTRLQILEGEFFEDDKKIASKKKLQGDPKVRELFNGAVADARRLANEALAKNPNDTNALFALTICGGMETDYSSLIDKRNIASLSYAKEAQTNAVRLLKIDPNFVDAYTTTGFSEYLLGSLPFFVRWFARFDDTQGNKPVAIQKLERVAESGHYLKPFAKILLAIVYLREKQPAKSEGYLTDLSAQYPQNQLFKTELSKIRQLEAKR